MQVLMWVRTAKAMTAAADAFCHATNTGPVVSCTSTDGSAMVRCTKLLSLRTRSRTDDEAN